MRLAHSLAAAAAVRPDPFEDLRRNIDPEWVVQALEATGTVTVHEWWASSTSLPGISPTVAPSSVAQARARLGPDRMEWLFTMCAEHWPHASARTRTVSGRERLPNAAGEVSYATNLWSSLPRDSLTIVDRGFYSRQAQPSVAHAPSVPRALGAGARLRRDQDGAAPPRSSDPQPDPDRSPAGAVGELPRLQPRAPRDGASRQRSRRRTDEDRPRRRAPTHLRRVAVVRSCTSASDA